MRVVAILATYNEERFIGPCLEHLFAQGVDVYLIDNESSDRTVEIARAYLGRGLIAVETLRRREFSDLRSRLRRKEDLTLTLDADWFMHVDADEIRLPPHSGTTIAQALEEVEAEGYNAVNFLEFTFLPTRESPDHDHPEFHRTMRWYYPFLPAFPHRLNAWKRQAVRVDLASHAGHRVDFPGLRMYPRSFPMRHYLFLSLSHAIRKYVRARYDPLAVQSGWHGWRARLRADTIRLPSQNELRAYVSDDELDPSDPVTSHSAVIEYGA